MAGLVEGLRVLHGSQCHLQNFLRQFLHLLFNPSDLRLHVRWRLWSYYFSLTRFSSVSLFSSHISRLLFRCFDTLFY